MKNIKVLFGRKIKELRKRLGMTQSDLAERVAVDNKHISCIESGKNFPSPDLIDRLGQALHVEPKDLFEFYHLQDASVLKKDVAEMLQNLTEDELTLTYKYIRTFILK